VLLPALARAAAAIGFALTVIHSKGTLLSDRTPNEQYARTYEYQ